MAQDGKHSETRPVRMRVDMYIDMCEDTTFSSFHVAPNTMFPSFFAAFMRDTSKPYAKALCQSLMPKPYAKALCQSLMPKPYAKALCDRIDRLNSDGGG